MGAKKRQVFLIAPKIPKDPVCLVFGLRTCQSQIVQLLGAHVTQGAALAGNCGQRHYNAGKRKKSEAQEAVGAGGLCGCCVKGHRILLSDLLCLT
jgi:hypothetical protein